MLSVIFSWIVLLVVFLAFGEITVFLWKKLTKTSSPFSVFDKVWIGICTIGTVLLYTSIFIPINIWLLAVVILIGCIFLIYNRKGIINHAQHIRKTFRSYSIVEKVILTLVPISILTYSLCTPLIYDEGLYHLQTMEWSEQFKVVTGLGNVHGRLGFNSSFLLLSTLFNYHPAYFEPIFTINSFALALFSFWLLKTIIENNNILTKGILSVVLLLSIFSLGASVSSTSTDVLVNILTLYLFLSWVLKDHFLHNKSLLIVALASFCITLKLSSSIIFLLIVAYIIYQIKRRTPLRITIFTLAIGLAIGIPWVVRFVVLTGYLVYPFPDIDIFSVDWKIPIEMVVFEKDSAYAWARNPGMDVNEVMNLQLTEWLPIWIRNLSSLKLVLYLIAIASPLFLFGYKSLSKEQKSMIFPWSIAFIGFIFGLFTAPDFRFSFAFILSTIVIPALLIADKSKLNGNSKVKKMFNYSLAILTTGLLYIAWAQVDTYQQRSHRSYASLALKPQPINILQDKKIFDEYKINNSTIFVPQGTNQCFDQPLPCSPYYNSNLEMRGSKIQDGFRIKK